MENLAFSDTHQNIVLNTSSSAIVSYIISFFSEQLGHPTYSMKAHAKLFGAATLADLD